VLLINIHQLDVIFTETVGLGGLEDEVDNIRRIFSLESEDIVILRSSKDLGQGSEVDTESNVAIAAEGSEHLSLQHHRYQSDVGVVHSLERDAGVIAIEVAVLNEIFNSIDDLCQSVVSGDLTVEFVPS
jgi:hypothetical protein